MMEQLTHDQIADQIEDAADIYEKHGDARDGGWFWFGDLPSKLCIEGALQATTGLNRPLLGRCPLYGAVLGYVRDQGHEVGDHSLWIWHDNVVRTMPDGKQFVLDILRGAAKHERSLA